MLKAFRSRVLRTSLIAASTGLVAVLTVASVATDDASARPKLKSTLPGESQVLVVAATEFSSRASYALRSAPEFLSSPPPARYFTINEVLAQRGGAAASSSMQLAAIDPKSIATDAPAAVPQMRRTDEPFGFATFRAPDGILWSKWRKVQAEMAAEAGVIDACKSDTGECKSPAARHFLALVKKARERTGRDRIDLVNRSVNADIAYVSDYAQHGVADLWSAPLAALGSGRGDCEDYAIAKYATLREAGIPADDLRFVLVRDNAVRLDHAVLAVRHDGRWLVLDNRHAILMEQADTRHFTPLFALDQSGVKLFAAPYARPRTPQNAAKPVSSPWPDDADLPLRGSISLAVAAAASALPDELPPI